jgi:Na+/proline symporter
MSIGCAIAGGLILGNANAQGSTPGLILGGTLAIAAFVILFSLED